MELLVLNCESNKLIELNNLPHKLKELKYYNNVGLKKIKSKCFNGF